MRPRVREGVHQQQTVIVPPSARESGL